MSIELTKGHLLKSGIYEIQHNLGQGGFGITYYGLMLKSEQRFGIIDLPQAVPIVIKEFFIKDSCSRSNATGAISITDGKGFTQEDFTTLKNNLLKEALIISKLDQQPNLIKVYDCFEENNTIYVVMEYLSGNDLEDAIAKRKTLTEKENLSIINQVLAGLEVVHAKNILHLDIKPSNVMIVPDKKGDRAVLIDFGASKNYNKDSGSVTSVINFAIGTDGYAPKEQLYAKGLSQFSPQTDIYSLGAMWYHCRLGRKPIGSQQRENDELPDLDDARQISFAEKFIIKKCLRNNFTRRFSTVAELRNMIEKISDINVAYDKIQKLEAKQDYAAAIDAYHQLSSAYFVDDEGLQHRASQLQVQFKREQELHAEQLENKGAHTEAIKLYNTLARMYPNDAQLYTMRIERCQRGIENAEKEKREQEQRAAQEKQQRENEQRREKERKEKEKAEQAALAIERQEQARQAEQERQRRKEQEAADARRQAQATKIIKPQEDANATQIIRPAEESNATQIIRPTQPGATTHTPPSLDTHTQVLRAESGTSNATTIMHQGVHSAKAKRRAPLAIAAVAAIIGIAFGAYKFLGTSNSTASTVAERSTAATVSVAESIGIYTQAKDSKRLNAYIKDNIDKYASLDSTSRLLIHKLVLDKQLDDATTQLVLQKSGKKAIGASTLQIANSLYNAKKIKEAHQYYKLGYEYDNSEATLYAGMLYAENNGAIPKDLAQALPWFAKAAQQGNGPGMTKLGELYYEGAGCTKDLAAAKDWFTRAAAAGDSLGKVNLKKMQ
jgi:serine/threonine protein kinase/TPR repeat protein